ncbi:MAG: radical SAM family heme chaperone HemW [bacterium]
MPKSWLNPANKPKNLYIHIPFCAGKCHYCNFISFSGKNEFIASYFAALKAEMKFCLGRQGAIGLETIYIGGGTPSVVDTRFYKDIFGLLSELTCISLDAEITMEINPGTVNINYLKEIRDIGINRLSIGVQSFDDKILKSINRIHSSQEAIETVKTAKKAGFANISIDLIYGLPEQTIEGWETTLNKALSLGINHISTYGLKIEEGTEFSRHLPKNLPDDEVQSQIYLKTIDILENNGFNHYEISNFSKKGFESRHNLCYWKNKKYFALGLSAHGYLDDTRYSNTENLEEYLKDPTKSAFENQISAPEKIEEAVFLGLRLTEGINTKEFKLNYGIDIYQKYSKIIEKYIDYGFMTYDSSKNLKLTKHGILLSNSILADFLA